MYRKINGSEAGTTYVLLEIGKEIKYFTQILSVPQNVLQAYIGSYLEKI